ncbi:hypothetical protein Mapa_012504 [Marchantia paleacea]|nr:hypothetical protein Mapa_012504 [Marchantia paleacea]
MGRTLTGMRAAQFNSPGDSRPTIATSQEYLPPVNLELQCGAIASVASLKYSPSQQPKQPVFMRLSHVSVCRE